ncbi:hypothetical protein KBTX_04201 [wastewater metagenome]|uniref:Uncharacterized protein n=2 Tax=unclassified sequences TaxID=12908 RepID=A0A5B8RGV6_9ZZZZ|nr:hypothetical protein KBTEX_04201 [uncultured organism]
MINGKHLFKRMRERPVPDIMQQSCRQRKKAIPGIPMRLAVENGNDAADNFIHAERMAEPTVFRTMKCQIRRSELANAPQPLKLFCSDQFTDQRFLHVYVTVNRIFEHLFLIQL